MTYNNQCVAELPEEQLDSLFGLYYVNDRTIEGHTDILECTHALSKQKLLSNFA